GPSASQTEPRGCPPLDRPPSVSILNRRVQYTQARLDDSFAALSVATRRGVLEQLGRSDASITDLAEKFHMTLTGMKKHVGVLEQAGRVITQDLAPLRTPPPVPRPGGLATAKVARDRPPR